MIIFGEREIAKAKFYAASKLKKFWDVNVDNIVISILVKTKTNSSYNSLDIWVPIHWIF